MFPNAVYDRWEEHLEKDYIKAFRLQDKLNYQRVQQLKSAARGGGRPQALASLSAYSAVVRCELCRVTLSDPEEFIAHCRKDPIHIELQTKFTDETYDFLFDESQFGELAGPASALAAGATSLNNANANGGSAGATTSMISTSGQYPRYR